MILFLGIVLAALLFLGTPVFVGLSFAAFLAFALFSDATLTVLAQRMFAGIDKFSLLAIPFFILGANVMKTGGIAERILHFALTLIGSVRGGMAYSTQLSSMFFGAISGSSPATVVAIGNLMYPSLIEKKYGDRFSIGLITASGSVALLIPPSISAIVYAAVTGASVGALFMAGLGAGIVYGLAYIVYIYFHVRKTNVPTEERSSLKDILISARRAGWALGIPVIIIGGIYTGIFTPTESAAVAAVYAIIIALFVYKEMSFKDLYKITIDSAVSTSQIMLLLAGASIFGYILTMGQAPQALASLIGGDVSPIMFLLYVNIILLIAGMFIDGSSAIIIMAPLLYPISTSLGIDPIHFGVIMVANASIGMFTPPFGLNLFVAQSQTRLPLTSVMRGVIPFVFISIIALLLITYIPQISLLLPDLVYGR